MRPTEVGAFILPSVGRVKSGIRSATPRSVGQAVSSGKTRERRQADAKFVPGFQTGADFWIPATAHRARSKRSPPTRATSRASSPLHRRMHEACMLSLPQTMFEEGRRMPAREDRQPFPNRARFLAFSEAHSRLSQCPFLDPPGAISVGPAHERSGVCSGAGSAPSPGVDRMTSLSDFGHQAPRSPLTLLAVPRKSSSS